MPTPTPFKIAIPQGKLDAIMARVAAYQWHEMPDIAAGADRWAYGTDMAYMRELCDYWRTAFDWHKAETRLNAYPQFKLTIDGQEIHYLHIKGSGTSPQPMLLTHGWPGSVFEFYDAIERLAHPEKFGGRAEDGLDLVIPSLPGYGFSGKPGKPVGPKYTAALWDKLMREGLGYKTYLAQGGDWGAVVTGWLGYLHGTDKQGGCKAIHINMNGLRAAVLPETDEEKAWAQTAGATLAMDGAYLQIQMTKPQTLSYAMMDSPVGAAAWIVEKMHSWSDRRAHAGSAHHETGHLENAFTKDQMLTDIMIYLVTETFNTATWFYRGYMEEGGASMEPGTRVEVPTGMAKFPGEALSYCLGPRGYMEKGYNVVHWSEPDRGGHFAAFENPVGFATDVSAFAAQIKSLGL